MLSFKKNTSSHKSDFNSLGSKFAEKVVWMEKKIMLWMKKKSKISYIHNTKKSTWPLLEWNWESKWTLLECNSEPLPYISNNVEYQIQTLKTYYVLFAKNRLYWGVMWKKANKGWKTYRVYQSQVGWHQRFRCMQTKRIHRFQDACMPSWHHLWLPFHTDYSTPLYMIHPVFFLMDTVR